MTLSIRQLGDAIPGCNLLIKTGKGTVIYNGPTITTIVIIDC